MSFYKRYCVFDLETGGFNSEKHAITEIAMIAIDSETEAEIDRFELLIKPYDAEYTDDAARVSGISKELLKKEGIPIENAFVILKEFLIKHKVGSRKPILVGHNIDNFDIDFLRHQLFDRFKEKISKYIECKEEVEKTNELLEAVELVILENIEDDKLSDKLYEKLKTAINKHKSTITSFNTLDTLTMSRHYIAEAKKHTLTLACAERGVVIEEAHRAMPDTEANAKLFLKLLKAARSDGSSNGKKDKMRVDFFM